MDPPSSPAPPPRHTPADRAALGIGQHTALAFAKHGITKLALADINLEVLQASNAALKEQFPHVEILTLHLDVRSPSQVKDGIAKVVAQFGRLDIAVNNAGISGSGRQTHEIENDEWLGVLDVNLQGIYRCQKEELAVMVKQEYDDDAARACDDAKN
ncbi:hypothetical protein Neosp_006008 [[Neocosmospora] mangrovei]